MKKNWTSKFGLTASAHVQCNLLPLESFLSQPPTLWPLQLEHHAMANFVSFSKVFPSVSLIS